MCYKTFILFFHSFMSSESRIPKMCCFNIRSPRLEFERPALSISSPDKRFFENKIKKTIVTNAIYNIEYHKIKI